MASVSPKASLSELASRYIDVPSVPWKATSSPGIDVKVLYEDKARGLMTALFRWAPGARLKLHEHIDIEQTYVLEGSLADHEGEAITGNFVWRPSGSQHEAWAPNGAVTLSIFMKPNKFFGKMDNRPKDAEI